MSTQDTNALLRNQSSGLAQGTNVLNNLMSLNDMLSGQSIEDLEKKFEHLKVLKSNFFSNEKEMRKKLGLLDCESVLAKGDATFRKENDTTNFGQIILTEFRFIFEFLEKNSEKEKFKEDYFKIPYLLFDKIKKDEQKSTYLPFTISVRDGRKLKFYIYERNKDILNELNFRAFPKKFDILEFPQKLNQNLNNIHNIKK